MNHGDCPSSHFQFFQFSLPTEIKIIKMEIEMLVESQTTLGKSIAAARKQHTIKQANFSPRGAIDT
jgi:hypothetical protein